MDVSTWGCEGGGCNGRGPPLSNSWAELKRCSLSIITNHIRLFMAVAHPSAPSSRIMSHQKAWIISDWLLHDTEHIVLQTPPQSSSLSAMEQLRSLTPQNCALKWNHQAFFSLYSDLLWKLWGTDLNRTCAASEGGVCLLAAAGLGTLFLAGFKAEDCRFYCRMNWYVLHRS